MRLSDYAYAIRWLTCALERVPTLLQYLRQQSASWIIALAATILFSAPLGADELRPALVNLTQEGPQSWQAEFKQPQVGGRFLNLRLTTNCNPTEPKRNLSATYLTEHFKLACTHAPLEELNVEGLEGSLIDVLVSITPLEGTADHYLLSPAEPKLVLASTAVPSTPIYLRLGITHLIFGLDHLLFILLLPFLIRGLTPLFWVITSFTLAHSITLSLAALSHISPPEVPTEALIALSIALVAREALRGESLIKSKPWLASFGFGLLHGFGFAGALGRIGLPPDDALSALFLFNVGIEVGQLSILLPLLALLAAARHWQLNLIPLRPYPLYAIGGISMMWFIQRII